MELLMIVSIQLLMMAVGLVSGFVLGIRNKMELFSISYLLGSGLVTFVFFVMHWLISIPLNSLNFIISCTTLLSIGLVYILISGNYSTFKEKIYTNFKYKDFKEDSLLNKSIIGVIFIVVGYSFFENYFWPITDWDAVAFYDFRARIMSLNGDMYEGLKLGYFFQYPPYTSFLHVFGYVFGLARVKIAYTFIYASFLATFYSLLKRVQNREASLLVTLILATNALILEHAVTAYTNLAYTAFLSLGVIYLLHYVNSRSKKDMIVGSILIALSTWVRSTEPFWIVGVLLLWIPMFKNAWELLGKISLTLFMSYPDRLWRWYIRDMSQRTQIETVDVETHSVSAILDFTRGNTPILLLLQRAVEVSMYLVQTLAPHFLTLSLLFVVSNSFSMRKKVDLAALVVLSGIVWGGTYIFSFTYETWNLIGGSVVRMCMIFIPLLLFTISRDFGVKNV